MVREPGDVSSIDEDKYEQSQKRYWEQLRQEFNRFKSELGATNSELAQCLGISRQPLVSFMQNSSLGLPIQRSNLERLWDLLTDPEQFKEKRLSSEARSKREDLRRKGASTLLKAAGFLPSSSEQVLDISPGRYQQIQRIVSRLSNLPITESADFIRLVESIESFISRAFPSGHKIELDQGQLPYVCMPSEEIIERWMKDNHLHYEPESDVEKKFKGAVSKLAVSGKYELEDSEMFELYMSILENERLYGNINEFLKMRITQCQFKTLTFLLKEYSIDESIWKELNQSGFEAERQLRFALCDTHYIEEYLLENAVSDVVIEVSIVCNFTKTNENVYWRYSSSTTHLENMFAAMSYGMGCESELELTDLSIRSLGRRDYSLVKTSAVFRSINAQQINQSSETYQGVWVDRSTILGILQSVVIAIRGWLAEKFTEPDNCESYYQVCKAVATLDESLAKGRKVLNGYRIQDIGYSGSLAANYYLEKEVIDKIQELQNEMLERNPALLNLYGVALENKYCIAKLSCAHSSLIEGDMVKAAKLLADVEIYLEKYCKNTMLKVLFNSEKKLQLFFVGNREFSSNSKKWRSDLDSSIKALSECIYRTRKDCGRFDYDTYMIASEIFGRMGRLDFCLCDLQDSNYLEQAVQNFLRSAYCSSKIGHKQRAAHWISNASRVCSRLGYGDRAKGFSDLAKSIIDRVIEPAYSFEYREALMAEINMSYGEQLLLIEKDFDGALNYFLKSLKGSIYIGFVRLIADGLYDIARASNNLGNYRVRKSFEDAFGETQDWELKEDKQGWKENKIVVEVIKFVNQVDKNVVWSSVSEQFKQQAKKIWHDWANFESSDGQAQHPIEDEIDSYRYLIRVK